MLETIIIIETSAISWRPKESMKNTRETNIYVVYKHNIGMSLI